jgi:Cu+-exporting ATPase
MTKDPVCGRTVIEARSAARSRYRGKTYHFCGPICLDAFERDPESYIKVEADQRGMQRMQAPPCCQSRP